MYEQHEVYSGEVYYSIYGCVHTVVVKWSDIVICYGTFFAFNALFWPLRHVNTVPTQMSVYSESCTVVYNSDFETMIP